MNRKLLSFLLFSIIFTLTIMPPTQAGHKMKLKKIAKMLLLANALTGKKILLPLPLPLPIPIFQENIKHIPYEVMDSGYGMGGYGGGMMGGYGGGYGGMGGGGGGYGGGMGGGGGGYGGGMGGGMKGGGGGW